MNTIQQYLSTIKTSAKPLPIVARKPALLKIWLLNFSQKRLVLLALLGLAFLIADPVSQFLVDTLYSIDRSSFTTAMKDLFNNPAFRELERLRETRYFQIFLLITGLATLSFVVVLIIELPVAIEKGANKAQELLGQSKSIQQSNPQLAESLQSQASLLLLNSAPVNPPKQVGIEQKKAADSELKKTVAAPKQKKPDRYVGPDQRYLIVKALASGGAGVVYLARDKVLDRKVAIKELLETVASDEEQAQRFQDEARALARLNHPCILPVYDLIEENRHFWLVMELLTGGTLSDKIEQAGQMDINESIEIIKGIASGLGFAHQNGFVHRDIKPENILFAADGSYRISDFGIAKSSASNTRTQHGLVLGSPGYMSPEQASGEVVDQRSDLYSLGITLYQMMTGKLPFEGEISEVMAKHITQQPQKLSLLNADITPALEELVMKMLVKQPQQRFQSTGELIEALDALKLENGVL